MAPAPASRVETGAGTVRAASSDEAAAVSALLVDLRPRLIELLPGARQPDELEVWIQDRPSLYAIPGKATSDAEGLWAESHSRILLARGADHLERTLAHELVHAHLGPDWNTLPGTLEEGLCDHISGCLAPDGAARLRAGRLSSAALLCGGIQLELVLRQPESKEDWTARIALSGARGNDHPQREVFRLAAGLSSTRLEPAAKRGYYGMAYLLMSRLIERRGIEGLHALCVRAADEDFDSIPRPWLLDAAELSDDRESWGRAAIAAIGDEELFELIDMHPGFAVDALVDYLESRPSDLSPETRLDQMEADLTLVGGSAKVRLAEHPTVRTAVLKRLQY